MTISFLRFEELCQLSVQRNHHQYLKKESNFPTGIKKQGAEMGLTELLYSLFLDA